MTRNTVTTPNTVATRATLLAGSTATDRVPVTTRTTATDGSTIMIQRDVPPPPSPALQKRRPASTRSRRHEATLGHLGVGRETFTSPMRRPGNTRTSP
ncbi:MAG: hypothetical protein K0R62_861 [Nonomuraea muscovyensis]|nr:hypothetical protein [Nonomuraea muscovyensis]